MPQVIYSIKKNRLKHAAVSGMVLDAANDAFDLMDQPIRRVYLPPVDAATEGSTWGRFSFSTDITEEMAVYVYAVATDLDTYYDSEGTHRIMDFLKSDASDEEKKKFFKGDGGERFVGKDDMLLYALSGRYLFLCIEIVGDGVGRIDNMKVDLKGDRFMDTFPAVYRERNSFLHRYLSIFSSIYNDMESQIDELPLILNADTAPVDMLPVYAKWLGIDLSGDYLSEEAMRTFVREGYNLNRMKGTKACIERVLEIVLGERVIILEQNTIQSYLEKGDMEDVLMSRNSIYDVNILIRKEISETDRHQLLYLLRQFVPLRSRIHLIQLKDSGVLDTDIYLDMNAIIAEESYGVFDKDMEMDDGIILE